MTTDNRPEPEKNQAESLRERIHREATRRAKALAESFDLFECMHLKAFGLDPEELDEELAITLTVQTRGPRRHIGETQISLEDLNIALQEFLEERLPQKIAERLFDQVLSSANPDIDVTELNS